MIPAQCLLPWWSVSREIRHGRRIRQCRRFQKPVVTATTPVQRVRRHHRRWRMTDRGRIAKPVDDRVGSFERVKDNQWRIGRPRAVGGIGTMHVAVVPDWSTVCVGLQRCEVHQIAGTVTVPGASCKPRRPGKQLRPPTVHDGRSGASHCLGCRGGQLSSSAYRRDRRHPSSSSILDSHPPDRS